MTKRREKTLGVHVHVHGGRGIDYPPATIPTDISTSTSRPDLVLISGPEVTFLELTVPFNSPEALAAARSRKSLKSNYLQLVTDLEDSGWSASYFTLEIVSLGHFEPNAIRTLSDVFHLSKQEAKQVLMNLSRITISCSYHIFNARLCSSWDVSKPIYFILSHFYLHYTSLILLPCQAHHLFCVGTLLS